MERKNLELTVLFNFGDMVRIIGDDDYAGMNKLEFIRLFGGIFTDVCIDMIEKHLESMRQDVTFTNDPAVKENFIKREAIDYFITLEKLKKRKEAKEHMEKINSNF